MDRSRSTEPNSSPAGEGKKDVTSEKLVHFFKKHRPPMAPDPSRPLPPTLEEFVEMFDEDGNLKPEFVEE